MDDLFISERLIFRPLTVIDLPDLMRLNSNSRVMRYFPAPFTEVETKAYYEKSLAHYERYGFSNYAVCLKETGDFIGVMGLLTTDVIDKQELAVEIGWRLLPDYWGQGYAAEGAEALMNYGFGVLNLPTIYAFTAIVNQPSEAVMKRIGMKKVGYFKHPKVSEESGLKEHVLYQSSPNRK
ncbi:hypothetical protein CBF34_08345 [Vagococcus penaei]|uniref:Uncharacterized protein n=1 Tax=Vagococcus penaei TaxID=633807 RepID=A0A1Q2D5T9_9ENTE|nr:GNAT family N-acetyltransferase [Vagococcus penaei]AQP53780.1 hypothetical protein BW732_05685 [Vagococcus penaei]RSU00389.1 hypothetical protein CBF34_08345 [Vagococcus penaei]